MNEKVALNMYRDLITSKKENFVYVLMNLYTRESFLYKDLNRLLR